MNKNIFYLVSNNKKAELAELATQEDLNIRFETGDTPLMSAIRNEYVEIVELFLKAGANPDYSNKGGWFPLHFATQQRNMPIVELLVKYGATIDQQDSQFGTTPLFVAISKTEGIIFIDYFLKQRANPDITNIMGVSASMAAKRKGIDLTQF